MKMSEEKISNIQYLLEDKGLLLLTNQDKIEEAIYILCNENNTTLDIAKTIGKNKSNVLAVLNNLRKKRLVKTVKKTERRFTNRGFRAYE